MASLVHNIVDSARNKLSAKIDNTIAGITNNGLGPIDNKALRATLLINRANPKLPKINFLEYEGQLHQLVKMEKLFLEEQPPQIKIH